MSGKRKTVIFEKKYGTDIERFSTTEEIDDFLDNKLGRKLKVRKVENNVVARRGSAFPFRTYDISGKLDALLKR